ncbi:hypothetical protein [Pontibacter harenae]|uniref:hypothetical protein n=1 Tax=Pontibacter harenae TaxID=2894083 RepID=UPI001E406D29|nr:hypothetical protein [Pontibacter harenae]MCC9167923.1 hypothetical protein [Pontibacter harenae]
MAEVSTASALSLIPYAFTTGCFWTPVLSAEPRQEAKLLTDKTEGREPAAARLR